MQNPSFTLLQFPPKELASQAPRQSSKEGFFDFRAIGEILRTVFLTSVLWVFLAIIVDLVYTMIIGRH